MLRHVIAAACQSAHCLGEVRRKPGDPHMPQPGAHDPCAALCWSRELTTSGVTQLLSESRPVLGVMIQWLSISTTTRCMRVCAAIGFGHCSPSQAHAGHHMHVDPAHGGVSETALWPCHMHGVGLHRRRNHGAAVRVAVAAAATLQGPGVRRRHRVWRGAASRASRRRRTLSSCGCRVTLMPSLPRSCGGCASGDGHPDALHSASADVREHPVVS